MSKYRDMRVVALSPIMYPEAKFLRCAVNMVAYSWANGLMVEEIGITEREVVDWARNNLARAALEGKGNISGLPFTHLLWMDSDHVFNPDLACRLAGHFQDPNIDMVSALYYGRTEPYGPIAYVRDFSGNEHKHFPIVEVPATICEVDAIGFGACMIKREVFERVPEPWFTVDWKAGEDIAFCAKAKKHGVRIFVDGAYKLGHIGTAPIITEKTYLQYQQEHPEVLQDKVRVGLGGQRDGV